VPAPKQWTPAEKAAALQKYFANDPRWANGIIDPTAPIDRPELYGDAMNIFADHSPTPGSIDPTAPIDRPELYGDAMGIFVDHSPTPGSFDPSAPITRPEVYGGNRANTFAYFEPLTLQEVEEAWQKILSGQDTPPPPEYWERMRRSPLENWFRDLFSSSKKSSTEQEKVKSAPSPAAAGAPENAGTASNTVPYE
jgi:hypothetical protein